MPKRKAQVEAIKNRLETERESLVARLDNMHTTHDAEQSAHMGEVTYDDDLGDLAAETLEREKEHSIELNLQSLIDDIDRALAKMNLGTYGDCESCGTDIPEGRLDALPYTTLCVSCKEKQEKGR